MKELWQLFWAFSRIGSLTFGGGYAMLPIIQRELVEKRGWTSEEELLNYYALGQTTPGVIAVNTASFVGYDRHGVSGAIFATLGVIFPSVIIITVIAIFLQRFQDIELLQHAFGGIRIAVVALIASAVLRIGRQTVQGWMGGLLFTASLLAIGIFDVSPILVIVIAASIGVGQALLVTAAPLDRPKRIREDDHE